MANGSIPAAILNADGEKLGYFVTHLCSNRRCVRPDHLQLVKGQKAARGWSGTIVTNPNCSTIVLTMALASLLRFGIQRVIAATMQAVSGAGYPGVPSGRTAR